MQAEAQEIYQGEREDEAATPIVLIHDGGGTVFQYYMLEYLGRRTYAIANPYFESGSKPEGGLPELAKEYVKAIQAAIGNGPVILGGWSFGGMISVEVARLFQETPSPIHVVGIIMIDSFCPWSQGPWLTEPSTPRFRPTTSQRMKELTIKSFTHAREMIASWEMPAAFKAPPVAMIQAEEVRELDEEDGKLGWSKFECLNFVSTETVPGNHFSMFNDDRVAGITRKIRSACEHFAA
ncbi:hypothetical protein AMS68_004085 [Peltaster fructicola]|uniref:Thioesterase domain-containing protein n=1 Tax=Peltaster fructicola TaxID=286661 RepID=A0A6H0XVC9_9PEZI|nr:hypothetical protein AMS68_004085 [Peltaster fructicola]